MQEDLANKRHRFKRRLQNDKDVFSIEMAVNAYIIGHFEINHLSWFKMCNLVDQSKIVERYLLNGEILKIDLVEIANKKGRNNNRCGQYYCNF